MLKCRTAAWTWEFVFWSAVMARGKSVTELETMSGGVLGAKCDSRKGVDVVGWATIG